MKKPLVILTLLLLAVVLSAGGIQESESTKPTEPGVPVPPTTIV